MRTSALCGLGREPFQALSWGVLWRLKFLFPYTLMYAPSPTLLARPYQMSLKISHHDFTPIATVGTSFPTISVKKDHRWKSFADFQDFAESRPAPTAS